MTSRTYYDLRLKIEGDALHPLTVRALRRIVEKHGDVVSFDVLVDDMFGVSTSVRASKMKANVSLLRQELDTLSEHNAALIESGPLGSVSTHGYRLTAKAVEKIDGRKSDESNRKRN